MSKLVEFTSLRSHSRYEIEQHNGNTIIHKYGGLSGCYCGEILADGCKALDLYDAVNHIIDTDQINQRAKIAGIDW